jgi:RNA polymerase sigma-70 factor (ECF subfamily)
MNFGSIPANDLAKLCLSANTTEAWEEFVRRFQPTIRLTVMRTAGRQGATTPQFVDDMVQEVLLGLCDKDCKVLRDFVPEGPDFIFAYLKTVTENLTRDYLRSERRQKRWGHLRREDDERLGLDVLVADYGRMSATDRQVLLSEIDRELQRLVPGVLLERDRDIFWLYFAQGFTARDIGDVPNFRLSVKGVESSLHRSIRYVRQNLRLEDRKLPRRARRFSGPISGETS